MSRKTKTFVVKDEGRDKGKHFLITEQSAAHIEDWTMRALLALGASNVDIPEGALNHGAAALVQMGLMKLVAVETERLRPLLKELMECAELVPNPQKTEVRLSYPLYEDQIEEARTLFAIKWEALKLHMDFSLAAKLSEFVEKVKANAAESIKSSMQTSPESLESSSEGA